MAEHLLEWAGQGLPILFVHNTREVALKRDNLYNQHVRAASSTPGLDDLDVELTETITKLLRLPNVVEVDQPNKTLTALRSLGVRGRAEFVHDNKSVLTHLREDGQRSHLFLYHFLYENGQETEVEVALQGEGAVFELDEQNGSLKPIAKTRHTGGCTMATVKLQPGESTIVTFDRTQEASPSDGPDWARLTDLTEWDLTVEDWDAGEVEVIKEDRGLGYVTEEHLPHTKVTSIAVGKTSLKPWSDIPSVGPTVSGIGRYSTRFSVTVNDPPLRHLLDLGSTGGALGSVSINGSAPLGFDTSVPKVDVTDYIHEGQNELVVSVGSSLNNRLIARGYYSKPEPASRSAYGSWKPGFDGLVVREYGLMGPVTLYQS